MKIKTRIDAIRFMSDGTIHPGTMFYTNNGLLRVTSVDVNADICLYLADVFDEEDVRRWTLGDMVGKEFYR